MSDIDRSDWLETFVDPLAFAREQSDLGHVWTFLGLASETPSDGGAHRRRPPRNAGQGNDLSALELALCGDLVFGRFPSGDAQSLEAFLGESFVLLAALSRQRLKPCYFERSIRANWKLCCQISLDDYHLAAIHPNTLGKVAITIAAASAT